MGMNGSSRDWAWPRGEKRPRNERRGKTPREGEAEHRGEPGREPVFDSTLFLALPAPIRGRARMSWSIFVGRLAMQMPMYAFVGTDYERTKGGSVGSMDAGKDRLAGRGQRTISCRLLS